MNKPNTLDTLGQQCAPASHSAILYSMSHTRQCQRRNTPCNPQWLLECAALHPAFHNIGKVACSVTCMKQTASICGHDTMWSSQHAWVIYCRLPCGPEWMKIVTLRQCWPAFLVGILTLLCFLTIHLKLYEFGKMLPQHLFCRPQQHCIARFQCFYEEGCKYYLQLAPVIQLHQDSS